MTIPPMELRRISELFDANDFVFAKTMPHNPHHYTLRKKWADENDFVSVVQSIRAHGYVEIFGGRPYTMLNVNGHKYWTMGAPLDITILINRKVVRDVPHEYDHIAPLYDQFFSDPDSIDENRRVIGMLGDLSRERVLDIGCGTGLLLDYARPAAYTGIDPSNGMLEELRRKHPAHAEDVLLCRLEEFVGNGYDTAVALFGAASYIHPDHLRAVATHLRPGGRYFLMFYRPGYSPVTYQRSGHMVPHYEGVPDDLAGERFEIGNFVVVAGRRQ